MNNLDDVTFGRFARRFAQIERFVPAPPARAFPPTAGVQPRVSMLKRSAVLLGALLLLGGALVFASFGLQPTPPPTSAPRVTVPPDSAAPDVVLSAYLSALQARDCDAAEQFVGSFVYRWNDALCGEFTYITGFKIIGLPQVLQPNSIRQNTVLTITGGGIYPPGDTSFGFELQQQTGGAWRIIEALPGPPLPPNTPLPFPTPRPT